MGWMGMMLLFNGMAIGQVTDSVWQSKHPITISYCGIMRGLGTVTPSQIMTTDSLVLMYNVGNKYQIDSFKIEWDDLTFTCIKNFIGEQARAHIAKEYRHDEPYFWINHIFIKNKETDDVKSIPGEKIKISKAK